MSNPVITVMGETILVVNDPFDDTEQPNQGEYDNGYPWLYTTIPGKLKTLFCQGLLKIALF